MEIYRYKQKLISFVVISLCIFPQSFPSLSGRCAPAPPIFCCFNFSILLSSSDEDHDYDVGDGLPVPSLASLVYAVVVK